MANVHTATNSGPLQVWERIPIVTRYLISSIVVLTTLERLDFIPTIKLVYQFHLTVRHFQLWRLFTSCIILDAQAMPALIQMYNFYSRSYQLESRRDPCDYVFYLCFCIVTICVTVTMIYGQYIRHILTPAFASCLMYTWSVDNANVKVMFYGLFPMYGKYFPLIELFIALVFYRPLFGIYFIGFLTAYLYLCLDTKSWGPVLGRLFFANEGEFYGIAPSGYFGAPQWFKRQRREATSQVKDRGRGQKLGSKRDTSETAATTSASSAVKRAAELRASRSTLTKRSGSSGIFPGHGQRLGA